MTLAPPPSSGAPADVAVSARRVRTRERLLDAALEVFAGTGVAAATVEAVCERAGFTRGAFYSNFATKEELFLALLDRENGRLLASLRERIDTLLPVAPHRETLDERRVGEVLVALLEGPVDLRRWCLVENEGQLVALRDPAVARRWVADQDRFVAALVPLAEAAAERAGLRFTVGTGLAVRLLAGAHRDAVQDAMLRDEDRLDERLHDRMTALVRAFTAPL